MTYRNSMLLLAASLTAIASANASAQTASAVGGVGSTSTDGVTNDQALDGDIVVTARRVAENQQDVPMSLTAVGGDELRQKEIHMVVDLERVAPSLNISTGLSRNATTFTIRGQRGSGIGVGTGGGPAVVTYLAEAPFQPTGPGLFFDLQSVQVLNGPQGTLFGQNTTGGAVLFEPVRPTNKFEGYMMGTAGNYGRLDVEGVVNLPIVSDKLLFRAGFQLENREGFTRDVVTGRDYDNHNSNVFRASLTFRPSSRLEIYTMGYLTTSDENGPSVILIAANPAKPLYTLIGPTLLAQQARGIRAVNLDAFAKNRIRTTGVVNRISYDIADNVALTNIFSWSRFQRDDGRDDDGTPYPIQNSNGSWRPGTWNTDIVQFTEEFRVSGSVADKLLSYQLGFYYDRNKPGGSMTYSQNLQTTTTTDQIDAFLNAETKAPFGQIQLDMGKLGLPGLNLTAGYRYTWNDFNGALNLVSFTGIFYPPPTPTTANNCQLPLGKKYPDCTTAGAGKSEGESFAFGADYKATDNILLFANYKRGYRQGGINLTILGIGATSATTGYTYLPEKVDTVELGIKTNWESGIVRGHFNATGYYNKYDNIQVSIPLLVGTLTTGATGNAAKATIKGFELEGSIRFGKIFELNGGYSYIDARYDQYMSGPTDLSKLPFINTPKHQYNISANLTLPLPDSVGQIVVRGNYAFKGVTYVGDTTPSQPFSYRPSYGLIGGRIDWNNFLDTKNVDLSFYVTNLTDKVYRLNVIQQYNATGYTTAIYGEPRMYGASVRVRF